MGLGAEDSNEDEEVDWDEIMRKLRKLFSGEINEYSTEDDILNADLDLKFLANTDIPVVEISQSGIYFINENGEIIWFADINTSASMASITKFWMDPETALEYFNEKYSEMDSHIKAENLTALLAATEIVLLGQVFGATAATFTGLGLGAIGVGTNCSGTSKDSYHSMSHDTYANKGIIAVYTTVPIIAPNLGVTGILRVRDYYMIGGGKIGRVTLNN